MNKEYMVSVEVYTARLRKSKSMKACLLTNETTIEI